MGTEWVRRALVVEDQAALRTLVVEMLAREGWQAVGAANAVDASRLFTQFDPDVLVTDIDLGSRPTGAELALMLAQLPPHMGIVFLTSYPRAAAGAKAMGIPHAVFIAKQDAKVFGQFLRVRLHSFNGLVQNVQVMLYIVLRYFSIAKFRQKFLNHFFIFLNLCLIVMLARFFQIIFVGIKVLF